MIDLNKSLPVDPNVSLGNFKIYFEKDGETTWNSYENVYVTVALSVVTVTNKYGSIIGLFNGYKRIARI